jgi:hypothetical protein
VHSDVEQKSSSYTKLRDSRQNPTKAEAESADFRIHALMRRSSPRLLSSHEAWSSHSSPNVRQAERPFCESFNFKSWSNKVGTIWDKGEPIYPHSVDLGTWSDEGKGFFSRSKLHASLRSRERTSATVGDEGPANTGWIMERKYSMILVSTHGIVGVQPGNQPNLAPCQASKVFCEIVAFRNAATSSTSTATSPPRWPTWVSHQSNPFSSDRELTTHTIMENMPLTC